MPGRGRPGLWLRLNAGERVRGSGLTAARLPGLRSAGNLAWALRVGLGDLGGSTSDRLLDLGTVAAAWAESSPSGMEATEVRRKLAPEEGVSKRVLRAPPELLASRPALLLLLSWESRPGLAIQSCRLGWRCTAQRIPFPSDPLPEAQSRREGSLGKNMSSMDTPWGMGTAGDVPLAPWPAAALLPGWLSASMPVASSTSGMGNSMDLERLPSWGGPKLKA